MTAIYGSYAEWRAACTANDRAELGIRERMDRHDDAGDKLRESYRTHSEVRDRADRGRRAARQSEDDVHREYLESRAGVEDDDTHRERLNERAAKVKQREVDDRARENAEYEWQHQYRADERNHSRRDAALNKELRESNAELRRLRTVESLNGARWRKEADAARTT